MSTAHKRSHLQIFDAETRKNLVQISSTLAKTSFKASVPFDIEPVLSLKHADGDFPDVAEKLVDIDAEFVSRASTATSDTNTVRTNLENQKTAIEGSLATQTTNLGNQVSDRTTGQAADATARVTLDNSIKALITAEAQRARAAEQLNANNIALASTAITDAFDDLATDRTAAISGIQSQIDIVKENTDPAAIDSITELLDLLNGDPDSSLLTLITGLRTDLTALESVVNTLTNDYSLGSFVNFVLNLANSGTTVTGSHIEFRDSGVDGDYSNNETYNAIFDAGEGKTWTVTFNEFHFEHNDLVQYDRLSMQASTDGTNWTDVTVSWMQTLHGLNAFGSQDRYDDPASLNGNILPKDLARATELGYDGSPLYIMTRYVRFNFSSDASNVDAGWHITMHSTP